MNKEMLIKALGWIMWIAICVAIATALLGAQSRPIKPDKPVIDVYRVEMEDGSLLRCAVVDWRYMVALDCNWPAAAVIKVKGP